MKIWIGSALLGLTFLVGCFGAEAQGSQVVQIEKPYESRFLRGIVGTRMNHGPVPGVTVDDCSPEWKQVLSATVSDASGRFSFDRVGPGMHYLRLTAPGFNLTLVRVRVTKRSSHKYLSLEMSLGT